MKDEKTTLPPKTQAARNETASDIFSVKKMQVLLKKKIFVGHNETPIYKKFIEENAGKWVDVDTSCLFNDQYNTPGPGGCGGFCGLRKAQFLKLEKGK